MDNCEGLSTGDEYDSNLEGLVQDYNDHKNEVLELSPNKRYSKVIPTQLHDIIEKSAFKTTYRAMDSQYAREVAWNTLNLKTLTQAGIIRLSESVKTDLQVSHKNIISVYSSWINFAKSELVIITEIITGGSLKAYLRRLPQPRFNLIKNWCRGILAGLQHLHSQSPPVCHSDLSPSTIHIMSSDGTIKISDFYLNKLFSSQSPLLGSPEYLAPEVFEMQTTPASDVYSFGMILLEMCVKLPPYSECSNSSQVLSLVKSGVLPKSLDLIKDLEISEIIKKCLSPIHLRPTAEELLTHHLFSLNDHRRNNLPVALLSPLSRATERRKHVKTLSLILRDSKNCAKSVSFEFNPDTDTPETVAIEMIESFDLDKGAVFKVAKEIEKKLDQVKAPGLNVQIFRCNRSEFEPNTGLLERHELPCLQKSNSLAFDEETKN